MILRGISTPVQGGDAVNKDYVDIKVRLPDSVKIMNTKGRTAKSSIMTGTNTTVRLIPIEINLSFVLYAIDIYWYSSPATYEIGHLLNTPIKSGQMLLVNVLDGTLMDETKVEFSPSRGGLIRVNGSDIFGMGYLKLII